MREVVSTQKFAIRGLQILTVGIALTVLWMLIETFLGDSKNGKGASIIGVLGALLLAFLALASPGALEELSFGPFKVRWRITKIEATLESIQLAVIGLLSRYERSHLRKLAGKGDDLVEYRREMYEELERLQHLGYLKPRATKPDLWEMKNVMESEKEFHLKEYLEITKMGEKYLQLYGESVKPITVYSDGEVKVGGEKHGKAKDWRDIVEKAMDAGWIKEPDVEDVTWVGGEPAGLMPRETHMSADMGAVARPNGTTFRVWAPHAKGVEVAGSFDGWAARHPMAIDGGGCWSTQLDAAGPGDAYKYVVTGRSGELWKIDPRARRLTSSTDTGNALIDAADFEWGAHPWQNPGWDDLVIYELHVGTFNRTSADRPGRFSGVVEKLEELVELGVTAIELMPVTEYAGETSEGYNPVTAFAVAGDYGSPTDLKALISEAHQHGLAVLLDVVYNHFGWAGLDAGLRRFDGWYENDGDGIYFYNDWRRNTPWGDTRPDYGRPEVRQYLRDSALSWLEEYRVDGLRWDATAYIRNVDGGDDRGKDLADGWRLLREVNDEIDARQSWKISIAEDLRDDPWITTGTPEGAGFDSQWDAGFCHALRAALTAVDGADRDMNRVRHAIEHRLGGRALARVVYTESHDDVKDGEDRVPAAVCRGDAEGLYAKKRSTLGAAAVMTAPGIPMVFQGQEFLETRPFDDRVPLDWAGRERHAGIVRMYRDLIALRRNRTYTTAGLRGDQVDVYHCNDTAKVIGFHRSAQGGPGDSTVVVLNFGDNDYDDYRLGLPGPGVWRVRFHSDSTDYDSQFKGSPSHDVTADATGMDGLAWAGGIGIGRYSAVILSQDRPR
ncbi:alpha-amylase family glycosyl hydrolase [Streptomyces olivaceoviridis]|uniref:alpha-amylase family glycosyl hydrolase n=1 Tax=Streptomyces olivaceoviridis TaxID=1921 RepID=UPI0036F5A9AF